LGHIEQIQMAQLQSMISMDVKQAHSKPIPTAPPPNMTNTAKKLKVIDRK